MIASTHVTFMKKQHKKKYNVTHKLVDPNKETYIGYCFMKINNVFYDLTPLSAINNTFSFQTNSADGEQINFNICKKNAQSACSNKSAMVVSNTKCIEFAGDIEQDRIWNYNMNSRGRNILTLKLPHGEVCKNEGINGTNATYFNTVYKFTCDPTKVLEIKNQGGMTFDTSSCTNTIHMNTKYACPKEKFIPWWKHFSVPKQAVGVFLILIGLYFLIFGIYFWRLNNFLINFAVQGLIIYSILNLFTHVNMMLCILLGLAIAIFVFSFVKTAGISLGMIVGFVLGNFFYNLFIKFAQVDPDTLYWGLVLSFMVILTVVGGFIDTYMIVLATSLVGAYCFIRGIAIFAGGYPDENYIAKLLNKGEYTQFARVYGDQIYYYLFGILLMTVVGFIIQYFFFPKEFLEVTTILKEETITKTATVKKEDETTEKLVIVQTVRKEVDTNNQ